MEKLEFQYSAGAPAASRTTTARRYARRPAEVLASTSRIAGSTGRRTAACVRHECRTEGASPLWNQLEVTMSRRQLHETDVGF